MEQALRGGGRSVTVPIPVPAGTPSSAAEVDAVSRALLGVWAAFPELIGRIESLHLGALPGGVGRDLLESLRACSNDAQPLALDQLVSPADDRLSSEQKSVLVQLAASSNPVDRETAEQALGDCLEHLERREWNRESRSLTLRLEASSDPDEIERLLEAKQRMLEERRAPRARAPGGF